MNTLTTEITPPSRSSLPKSCKDLTVMIVDDSKTILKTAEILLNEQGCRVLTASDGFESLSIIAQEEPDMIFLDVMMPRLDGYQTCALIKSNAEYQSIPVIMLSSKDSIFDMARGRLAGSESYITKPFTRNDLLGVIEQYLEDINNPPPPSIPVSKPDDNTTTHLQKKQSEQSSIANTPAQHIDNTNDEIPEIEIPSLEIEENWEPITATRPADATDKLAQELNDEFADLDLLSSKDKF